MKWCDVTCSRCGMSLAIPDMVWCGMRLKCKMCDVEYQGALVCGMLHNARPMWKVTMRCAKKCGSVGTVAVMNNVAAAYAMCCEIVACDVRCGK